MSSSRYFFLALILILLSGCSSSDNPSAPDDGEITPPSDVSFLSEVMPIFTAAGCATSNCHGAARKSAGLELTAGVAYNQLVNINSTQVGSLKQVLPLDALNSYLMMKLEGRQTVGDRMPQGQVPLSSRNLQIIGTWIDEGAKDN